MLREILIFLMGMITTTILIDIIQEDVDWTTYSRFILIVLGILYTISN